MVETIVKIISKVSLSDLNFEIKLEIIVITVDFGVKYILKNFPLKSMDLKIFAKF